jgi:hypothetical protein
MALKLGALSPKQEAHFGIESSEVGRMLGGWLKSLSRRRKPADSNISSASEAWP